MGWAAILDNTSRNQANGSTLLRLQEAIKLLRTAAVLPPLSLPKNVQLPRPSAMSRLARSLAPLSIPDRHLRESVSAPAIDSAHNALRRPPGFSAEHPVLIPADTYAASPAAAPKRACARPAFAPLKAPALWRDPPLHTPARSDVAQNPCADPTPMLCKRIFWRASSSRPQSFHVPL